MRTFNLVSRILASILIIILLIQGGLQTLELRYCSDKLVAVELNGVKGICVCDSEDGQTLPLGQNSISQRSCCDFETLSIASSDFQESSKSVFDAENDQLITPLESVNSDTWPAASVEEELFYTDTSPPRKRKLNTYIFLKQFRASIS